MGSVYAPVYDMNWLLIVIIVLIVVSMIMIRSVHISMIIGGIEPGKKRSIYFVDFRRSPHIVVDTLNLSHMFLPEGKKLSPEFIASVIDKTSNIIKKKHTGRVMYVLKDRESELNTDDARNIYKEAATRNKVFVCIAEKYKNPPSSDVKISNEHSALGRDDFYISILANRWKCAVLSGDRLRDFSKFKSTVQPFHVWEYGYWKGIPERDFVRPESIGWNELRRPIIIHPCNYFPELTPNDGECY